jgi:colanic acid/amylovoran biosynthesis glycosyltransferase
MHVLMIGAGSNPPTFIERLLDVLKQNEVNVSLFPQDFPKFRLNGYLNAMLCRNGFVFHLPRSVSQAIEKVDLIHYQWPGHFLKYHTLAKKFGKPCVLSLRGRQITIVPHLPGQNGYVTKLKNFLPLCNVFHCVSENVLKEAQKYGVKPHNAWIITPAVDSSFFVPPESRLQASPLRILSVGALIWRKGYEYALLALKRLIDEKLDVELIIVGEGNEHDRLIYTIKDLGLMDNVSTTGRLSSEGVRKTMQQAHIFLHTSLSEGLPKPTFFCTPA